MATLATSFLIEFSSFLQVTRTCIKAWLSSTFGQIPPLSLEITALEHLKKSVYDVVAIRAPSLLLELLHPCWLRVQPYKLS